MEPRFCSPLNMKPAKTNGAHRNLSSHIARVLSDYVLTGNNSNNISATTRVRHDQLAELHFFNYKVNNRHHAPNGSVTCASQHQ